MDESLELGIGKLLREHRLTLAIGESCTGGLIGHRITNIPGSSNYFIGGVMAYAYEAKVKLLGVSWDTLKAYGAVSRQTVLEMAHGARRVLEADIGLSSSGIAGPSGATPTKPVGTSWVGLSTPDGDWACHFYWTGDRLQNKDSLAEAALQMLLDYLQGEHQFNTNTYE